MRPTTSYRSSGLLDFKPCRRSPLSDDEGDRYFAGERRHKRSREHPSTCLDAKFDSSSDENSAKRHRRQRSYAYFESSEEEDYTQITSIPPELLNRLKSFALFENAPKSFLTALGRSLKPVQYCPQEYIVKAGEQAKSMYWILRGTVGVTSTDGEALYAELAAGSFFGEIGILFNRPRTATVVARTKVLLGVLTKGALGVVLSDYPTIERLIRDEGQERLAMQQKRKQKGKPSTNFLFQRRENLQVPSKYNNDSITAFENEPSPGPVLPPTSDANTPVLKTLDPFDPSQIYIEQPSTILTGSIDNSISVREFLKGLPIFKSLPLDVFHELALKVEIKIFEPMEYIFKKGDAGRDIYFVVFGEVEVLDAENASHIVVARLGSGKYFGEMSFLSSLRDDLPSSTTENRSADVRAVSESEVLVVKGNILEDLCKCYPVVAEDMKYTAWERLKKKDSVGEMIHSTDITTGDRTYAFSLIGDNREKLISHSISWNHETYESEPPSSLDSVMTPSYLDSVSTAGSQDLARMDNPPSPPLVSDRLLKPEQTTIQWNVPSLNPVSGSLYRFGNSLRPTFHYIPHDHRLRLLNINNSQRRSSLLSSGPFPDSIFMKIFKYLDLPDLMRFATVCKKWKQLLYLGPELIKTLDLTPWKRDLSDNALIQITNFVGPRPEEINVSSCFHITDAGFSYMINEIGIRGCIKKLHMSNNWNISAMSIMDLSIVARELDLIDFSNCPKVRDDVIERLITPQGSKYGCPNLQTLNLSYCKYLTDRTMCQIAKNASQQLTSLNLTRCTTITDGGFMFWSQTRFSNLRVLVLRDCTFLSDAAISHLSVACPNLEELDLTFCCVLTDKSLAMLCLNCRYLRSLNLSFCGSAVSDNSLAFLARLACLEILFLRGCIRVTRQGVDKILSNLQNLKFLDLSQCPRVDTYQGKDVEPFEKQPGSSNAYLQISPCRRIIQVSL
ncbi:hypothetical protein KL911_001969 [Ogataea haglerorum]|uniref:uncharacterized protein n=1 Tax=Ogataea haglerorum TaxID=1937702 RepID=UPI001C89BA0D|nr:uncharacterized protein KL911_001969 [Ogataea haglerorum]KAG7754530.1 hypothetical protein KL911_001969 [Ogataea haglerorum]